MREREKKKRVTEMRDRAKASQFTTSLSLYAQKISSSGRQLCSCGGSNNRKVRFSPVQGWEEQLSQGQLCWVWLVWKQQRSEAWS